VLDAASTTQEREVHYLASFGTSRASSPTTLPLKPAPRSMPIKLASTVESLRVFWMNRVKNSKVMDLYKLEATESNDGSLRKAHKRKITGPALLLPYAHNGNNDLILQNVTAPTVVCFLALITTLCHNFSLPRARRRFHVFERVFQVCQRFRSLARQRA